MPEVKLLLRSEPEDEIDGWSLADGHWGIDPEGIGMLLIISPAMRARMEAGLDAQTLADAIRTAAICADIVLGRQRRAVINKALQQ